MSNYQEKGCEVCETFPYLEATGMCAACTFGEAQAQVDMLNGDYDGTVWQREKVNAVCGSKLKDRDEVIEMLEKMGVDFKQHNNGFHLRINTNKGAVDYYPTTRKVRYKGAMTHTVCGVNTSHSQDIIALIKDFGFDGKGVISMSMYAVNTLKDNMSVEVMGLTLPLDLNWADGMVGAIPVFKDRESALAYANGNDLLITQVTEVAK